MEVQTLLKITCSSLFGFPVLCVLMVLDVMSSALTKQFSPLLVASSTMETHFMVTLPSISNTNKTPPHEEFCWCDTCLVHLWTAPSRRNTSVCNSCFAFVKSLLGAASTHGGEWTEPGVLLYKFALVLIWMDGRATLSEQDSGTSSCCLLRRH